MAARQYYYTADATETTYTAVAYATKVALTFTPDANSRYLILWQASGTNTSNLTSDFKIRCYDSTGAATVNEFNIENQDISAASGDYQNVYGMTMFSAGASPSAQTYQIDVAAETAANIILAKDARILAMKLDSADQYTTNDANATVADVTYTATCALTFTPATTGDYLIISTQEGLDGTVGEGTWRYLAGDGTTTWHTCRREVKDATNWQPFGGMHKETLTAVSKTLTNQVNAAFLSDVTSRRSRIAAIRLDNFNQTIYNDANTRTTITTATYVAKATITSTPAAETYLVLGAEILDTNSATVSSFWEVNDGAQQYQTLHEHTGGNGTAGAQIAYLSFYTKAYTAVSTTFSTRARGETAAIIVGRDSAAIMALQMTVSG